MPTNTEAVTPLEIRAAKMRRKLYASDYACLPAFLAELAGAVCAEEAGVFSVVDGRVSLRRSSRIASKFDFLRCVDEANCVDCSAEEAELKKEIEWVVTRDVGSDGVEIINSDCRFVPDSETHGTIFLRRIWPSTEWLQHAEEKLWIYILSPKLLLQSRGSRSDEEGQQFGGLASAFIRWKNEHFSRLESVLSGKWDDPNLVLQEFEGYVIRPVTPKFLKKVFSSFDPKVETTSDSDVQNLSDVRTYRWCQHLERILKHCLKPACCGCMLSAGEFGGESNFECPQTEKNDSVLKILTDLEKWRTGFWRTRQDASMAEDRASRLGECIRGLKQASLALHWALDDVDESRFIDFPNGHFGRGGGRHLIRYFCSLAISMSLEKFEAKWRDPKTHLMELEFPAQLASLASTLLGNGPWAPNAITNLLELVGNFGHRVLGIPERIDLIRHLTQTLRGETALHTLKSRYRDHFFHTLEVCFLGFLILTSRTSKNGEIDFVDQLLETCKEYRRKLNPKTADNCSEEEKAAFENRYPEGLPTLPETRREFLAQWWTAALIHDTAYGIDIFDGTLKLMDFFKSRKEVKDFIEKARKTVKDMAPDLATIAPELGDGASLGKGDHGVIAASSLVNVARAIGPRTAARFQPAIRAIAFHNTRVPSVDAGVDPVAALLILCDTVQEWGRSSLGFDKSAAVLLSRMMEASSVPEEQQFGPVKRYGVSIEPADKNVEGDKSPEFYRWSDDNELRIELDYGTRSLEECAAKFTWADMTYNLQRVNFIPWGIRLFVQVSIPFRDENLEYGNETALKTQLDYFGEFVGQQQVRFIENWFRTAYENDPENAVRSWLGVRSSTTGEWNELGRQQAEEKREVARECVTFNLPKMSELFCEEKPLMGGHAGNFHDAIRAWSVYAREQLLDAPPATRPPV